MEPLNVIALISGGKDSFFSILHCKQNGHRIIALANLHPSYSSPREKCKEDAESEEDLNSFMFQTVGHTIIPFYAQALNLPLYRQEILGAAVQKGTSYSHASLPEQKDQDADETESLIPLLKKIMQEHPSANALSTGAILSTYQRTRIESVALRLGLIPLSFLWKYPLLPPGTQTSLLQDMQAVGLDARIVKVASGGLDERFLWQNITDPATIMKVEKAMSRFGTLGDGSVLGEGGEFETLVLDGPKSLFRGRIVVEEKQKRIVDEGGGAAWLGFTGAEVVMKVEAAEVEVDEAEELRCRVPDLLDERFQRALNDLRRLELPTIESNAVSSPNWESQQYVSKQSDLRHDKHGVHYWSISGKEEPSITIEAKSITAEVQRRLKDLKLTASNIISTIILLRNMSDFTAINTVYGQLFTQPNPPARVTISCGSNMPPGSNLTIHIHLRSHVHADEDDMPETRSLHVQSRSYWAPANIGPYSQAVSFSSQALVHIAGQIPLIPASMVLPSLHDPTENFTFQTILALQHLWRIGTEMQVRWWSSSVVYLSSLQSSSLYLPLSRRVALCAESWNLLHLLSSAEKVEEQDRDLWEEQNYRSMQTHGVRDAEDELPDWKIVRCYQGKEQDQEQKENIPPPVFMAEVQDLPRESQVEWHGHLGITKGPIEVSTQKGEGWVRYICLVDGVQVQDMVMIDYRVEPDKVLPQMGKHGMSWLSYMDADTKGEGGLLGIIPCQSLWAANGRRLTAVLFLLPICE